MICIAGKFKGGLKNFQTSLQPLGSEELLALLQAKDHEEEVGHEDEVISDKDLDALLDRSDITAKWRRRQKAAAQGRSFSLLP